MNSSPNCNKICLSGARLCGSFNLFFPQSPSNKTRRVIYTVMLALTCDWKTCVSPWKSHSGWPGVSNKGQSIWFLRANEIRVVHTSETLDVIRLQSMQNQIYVKENVISLCKCIMKVISTNSIKVVFNTRNVHRFLRITFVQVLVTLWWKQNILNPSQPFLTATMTDQERPRD